MATHAHHTKSQSRAMIAVLMVSMLLFGALFVPTAMLVVVGMLPTAAALLIDNDEKKSTTVSVGLLNAAGVVPYIIQLWAKGETMDRSLAIIKNPDSWMMMYGAAAIGWLVVYSVPTVIHAILAQRAKLRIHDIESRQAALVALWGEEVKHRQ